MISQGNKLVGPQKKGWACVLLYKVGLNTAGGWGFSSEEMSVVLNQNFQHTVAAGTLQSRL